MNKRSLIILSAILVVLSSIGIMYLSKIKKETYKETKMQVVLSLEDKITDDSVWCGTFNLIWNDLKNELAQQDIIFNPQLDVVKNLNKETFTMNNLSDNSYYKVYGHPTFKLKKQIENAIKEKFDEKSDILDGFAWEEENTEDYFLYVMLKKVFEFSKQFTELKNGQFANLKGVEYFGINGGTDDAVRRQVKVLYYNSSSDFAIKLITQTDDEVIISRGINKDSFLDIYNTIIDNQKKYKGSFIFGNEDTLKIPNVSFKLKKEFTELEHREFFFANGNTYEIESALQTIEFDLDKTGGKIKSEAGIFSKATSIIDAEEIREFIVDNSFVIFLQEKDKELPYFASKISNIRNVQETE